MFGKASGFQSAQYRILEFALGNKSSRMMPYYEHQPEWFARLEEALNAPSLYDEFLMLLARRGMPIPQRAIDRDFSQQREDDEEVVAVLRSIYEDRSNNWARYETCEALMDIANNF